MQTKYYEILPAHTEIQFTKLQLDISDLNTAFWHWTNADYFEQEHTSNSRFLFGFDWVPVVFTPQKNSRT